MQKRLVYFLLPGIDDTFHMYVVADWQYELFDILLSLQIDVQFSLLVGPAVIQEKCSEYFNEE